MNNKILISSIIILFLVVCVLSVNLIYNKNSNNETIPAKTQQIATKSITETISNGQKFDIDTNTVNKKSETKSDTPAIATQKPEENLNKNPISNQDFSTTTYQSDFTFRGTAYWLLLRQYDGGKASFLFSDPGYKNIRSIDYYVSDLNKIITKSIKINDLQITFDAYPNRGNSIDAKTYTFDLRDYLTKNLDKSEQNLVENVDVILK
jgi:hypothetical protein